MWPWCARATAILSLISGNAWDEINTGRMLSLLHHFGEWLSEIVGWVKWSCEKKNPTAKCYCVIKCLHCYKWASSCLTSTSSVEPCSPFTVQEHAAAQEVFPSLEHFRRVRFGKGFGEGNDFASRSVKVSLPFQRLWHIARDNASCWKYKRSQEAPGTTTKNRTAGVDIADILGVTEANVLMLLMVLNLTLGMVIITSTKFPHLHLLV